MSVLWSEGDDWSHLVKTKHDLVVDIERLERLCELLMKLRERLREQNVKLREENKRLREALAATKDRTTTV